jgi:hypothetical protein
MQTFLPYEDFYEFTGGWPNHPASKMWRGYEPALAIYALSLLKELKLRGRDYPKWFDFYNEILAPIRTQIHMPPWLGDERVHSSHRANLLRKDPVWYGKFGWVEEPREGYYWP